MTWLTSFLLSFMWEPPAAGGKGGPDLSQGDKAGGCTYHHQVHSMNGAWPDVVSIKNMSTFPQGVPLIRSIIA